MKSLVLASSLALFTLSPMFASCGPPPSSLSPSRQKAYDERYEFLRDAFTSTVEEGLEAGSPLSAASAYSLPFYRMYIDEGSRDYASFKKSYPQLLAKAKKVERAAAKRIFAAYEKLWKEDKARFAKEAYYLSDIEPAKRRDELVARARSAETAEQERLAGLAHEAASNGQPGLAAYYLELAAFRAMGKDVAKRSYAAFKEQWEKVPKRNVTGLKKLALEVDDPAWLPAVKQMLEDHYADDEGKPTIELVVGDRRFRGPRILAHGFFLEETGHYEKDDTYVLKRMEPVEEENPELTDLRAECERLDHKETYEMAMASTMERNQARKDVANCRSQVEHFSPKTVKLSKLVHHDYPGRTHVHSFHFKGGFIYLDRSSGQEHKKNVDTDYDMNVRTHEAIPQLGLSARPYAALTQAQKRNYAVRFLSDERFYTKISMGSADSACNKALEEAFALSNASKAWESKSRLGRGNCWSKAYAEDADANADALMQRMPIDDRDKLTLAEYRAQKKELDEKRYGWE